MSLSNLDRLFEILRDESSRGPWSRGVEMARAGRVLVIKKDPGEIVSRVDVPGSVTTPTAILYPVLEDWECDCNDDDPCQHVLATVIACRSGAKGETGSNLPKSTLSTLEYAFSRTNSGLSFERMACNQSGRQPLRGTLTAIARGRIQGPKISATNTDLEIEVTLGSQRSGKLPRGIMHRLLGQLEGRENVTLDGHPIRTVAKPLGFVARITNRQDDLFLQLFRDPPIDEMLGDEIVLANNQIRRLGHSGLSARLTERFSQGETFSPNDATELVTEIIPELRQRIPVEELTDRLPTTSKIAPYALIQTKKEGAHLQLFATVVYGVPAIARIDAGRLICLGDEIPFRNFNEEKRITESLRRDLGLQAGHKTLLKGSDAIGISEHLLSKNYIVTGNGHESFFTAGPLKATSANTKDIIRFEDPEGRAVNASTLISSWRANESLVPLTEGGFSPLPSEWLEEHGEKLADLVESLNATKTTGLPPSGQLGLAELCNSIELEAPKYSPGIEQLLRLEKQKDLTAKLFQGELRNYQRVGVQFVSSRTRAGFGVLLADDMGLGKTVQALASLPPGRTIVVAPTSVLTNWSRESAAFRPDLRVCLYHGSDRQLDKSADIILTSYSILRLDLHLLNSLDYCTAVLDEAQTIKNPDSQIARACRGLNAKGRVALTGTPIENRLEELWSIFEFLNPGLLGTRRSFLSRSAYRIESGDKETAQRLVERIRPFFLRRTKIKVAPELPKRQTLTLVCELTAEERTAYDTVRAAQIPELVKQLEKGSTNVLGALEALLRLRQACCHTGLLPGSHVKSSSKITLLLETLDVALGAGHKALIFSQWTSLLNLVEPELRKSEIDFGRIDGSTRDRAKVVDHFQSENGPPVLLISLKAGGTGLNLTAADHVFLLDPWWNPAVEDQAADRAHRIGQNNPVLIHRLIARGTVEEKVSIMQEKKRSIADIANNFGTSSKLNRNELIELLRTEDL